MTAHRPATVTWRLRNLNRAQLKQDDRLSAEYIYIPEQTDGVRIAAEANQSIAKPESPLTLRIAFASGGILLCLIRRTALRAVPVRKYGSPRRCTPAPLIYGTALCSVFQQHQSVYSALATAH